MTHTSAGIIVVGVPGISGTTIFLYNRMDKLMNIKTTAVVLFFIVLCIFIPGQIFCQENLLKNSGMENISGGRPHHWNTWQYNDSSSRYRVETGDAKEGNRYGTIVSDTENDARYIQNVRVKENTFYKISCWVKTEKVDENLLGANVSILNSFHTSEGITGTTREWTYQEIYIKTGKRVTNVAVSLGLGGYGSVNTGKASFDDIRMEEVSRVPAGVRTGFITPADQEETENGNTATLVQVNFLPGIITILIILLAAVAAGAGIFLFIRFKLYTKLPPGLTDWIQSVFPPSPPGRKGIQVIVTSPYLKVAVILLLIGILGTPFFLDISESIRIEPLPGNENHYVHLAAAMLEGKLTIPYKLHDVALYNGKYYVIYPPFPVLLVLPFVAIFGLQTKVTLIGIALALISCILLFRILGKVKVDSKYRPWILLAFFLGTGYWLCLRNCSGVAWFAHVVSVFALLLALHEVLGRGNGLLAGLFLGMAFLSRQLTIFFVFFFIAALWTHQKRNSLKSKLFHSAGFLATLGICVLFYLYYNYIRFGNPFDTGYSYLELGGFMAARIAKHGQFSIFHIPFNAVYMFLQGFHINYGEWPSWVTSVHEWWPLDPFGTAITFASPFIFYAFQARWKLSLLVSAWVSIGVVCLGGLMYYNNGWVQYNTQRFSMDFFPLFIVIIALGIQHGKKPLWKALILFSVALNALTMLIIPPAG